ncbi:MAG: efflux system outer rane lipoprotein, partial [Rhizorhabdus sp.]|nr:efflux system outer rane lipoprotein [Rhizorhabdus sp.]
MLPKTSILRGRARTGIAMSAFALLSACAAGPDFERPAAPLSQHYDRRAEQQLSIAGRIDGDWWSIFPSPQLDRVMRQAIEGNLDLAAADATIAQANEAVAAAQGGRLPQADFGAEAGGRRVGGSA